MSNTKPAPRTRTCVVTRTKLHDSQLLRVTVARYLDESTGETTVEIVPDIHRSLPGRGAWFIPTRKNYAVACERHALQRALRVPANVGTHKVGEYIEQYCR